MGLFKSRDAKENETLLASAVAMMGADGEIDDNEVKILAVIATRVGIDADGLARIMSNAGNHQWAMPTDPHKRALHLVYMILMMWADGKIDDNESKLLLSMGMSMGYSPEQIAIAVRTFTKAAEAFEAVPDPDTLAAVIAENFG